MHLVPEKKSDALSLRGIAFLYLTNSIDVRVCHDLDDNRFVYGEAVFNQTFD
ncbi:hypothetical protein LG298_23920 [Cytobacillus firmus]|uniref:hypothetical protein n=1 Tax=Cytobacillus firmus TaxID=1399 RepID=UPI00384C2229